MPTERRETAAQESSREKDKAAAALLLMQQALDLLDATDGAEHVGATLDLAIRRLRDWTEKS